MEESTTNLLNRLNKNELRMDNMKENLDSYTNQYPNYQIFSEYVANPQNHITISQIVKNTNNLISRSYAYEILSGKNIGQPSRNIILILCIAAHMNRKMTRRVLATYQHRDLYLKDPRDLIIATYLNTQTYNLTTINIELHEHNLPILDAGNK